MELKWLKNLLLLLFVTLLIPAPQAAADNVNLDPGYIVGQVNMQGFTPTSISTNANGGSSGYSSSKYTYNSSNYQMTVQGGDWDYLVTASSGLTGPNVSSLNVSFSNRNFPVAPGQSVTNNYAFNGTIRFQVNITGDPSTSSGIYSSSATKSVTSGEKTSTSGTSLTFGSSRSYTWDIPVVPNQQIAIAATVWVGGSTGTNYYAFSSTAASPYNIPLQDVAPGQVLVVPLNITFVAPTPADPPPPPIYTYHTGTIAGNVNLSYLPALNFLRHSVNSVNVTANPGSHSRDVTFTGAYSSSYIYPPNTYFDTSIDSSLRWPYNEGKQSTGSVKVYPDQTVFIDFQRDGGFTAGTVNFTGTVKNEDLKSWTFTLNGQGQVWDSKGNSALKDTFYGYAGFRRDTVGAAYKKPSVRDYKFALVTGDWNLGQISLTKSSTTPYSKSSSTGFNDYKYMYDGKNYLGSPIHIDAGVTTQKDFNYCFGSAIFRFRDLQGGLLSSPLISGSGKHKTNGVIDLDVSSLSANSSATNLPMPDLELFGPPADYTLTTIRVTAQDGSMINFPAMNLSLSCNTTKIFDIPGPTLIITNPQGDMITNVQTLTVTGRAFSGSTISSITVNGQSITFTPISGSTTNEVTFSYDLPASVGQNTITVTVTDVTNAQATEQLLVFVEQWLPTVSISTPAPGSSYLNTEMIPISVQAADQGYGYTLKVYFDGTEISSADGAANPAAPVILTYNGTKGQLIKGNHVVIATATDNAGNSATASSTFSIYSLDNTPPVVIPPPNVTVTATDVLTPVAIGTATATDNVGVVSLMNNAPTAYAAGITYVTWTANDAAGNIGTAVQTITVGCIPGTFSFGDNILISKPASAFANQTSESPAVSSDGRFVTFASNATNLVPNDTNGVKDIFRYDTQTGAITTMSVGVAGAQSNNWAKDPFINADGRYISFDSWATNLISPSVSGSVFRYDTQSGTTQIIPASNANGGPMSDNGRYMVFGSTWAIPLASNQYTQTYLYDFIAGTTELISKDINGVRGNQSSGGQSISADGRYVVFSSSAGNLVPGDTNGVSDVFVYDRQSGSMERVSVASDGTQGNGNSNIHMWHGMKAISDDGRYVVHESNASNLVPGDNNNQRDVFVYDRQTQTTQLISANPSGVAGNQFSDDPSMSGNGRYVTFMSGATDLVQTPRDTYAGNASYVRDLVTGVTQVVSVCANGKVCSGGPPAINYDGSVIAFDSTVSNLGAVDTNGMQDIYLHRRKAVCPAGDSIPPVVTPPPNITIEANGIQTQVNIGTATANDDFGVVSITSNAPITGFPLGTTIVTWTAMDAAGNSGTANQTIMVQDTTPPNLAGLDNIVVEATSTTGAAGVFSVTATDSVDPAPVITCIPASGAIFPLNATNVSCTARDFSGNAVTGSFTVTVKDTTPPVLTIPADKTVEAIAPLTPVAIGTATATDIFAVTVTNDAPASYPVVTTIVIWTATDASGNVTTKQQKITVQDTIAPVVTPPANMTVDATGTMTPVTVGSATATDTVGVVSLVSNAPASFPLGDTIITWTARDAAGNTGTATQTIIAKDSVAPVLQGLNNQTIEAISTSGAAASFTVTATDNIDPTPIIICTPTSGANFALGTATVTCTAKDAGNNSVTGSFTVAVKDTTPPVLTIPADKTVEAIAPLTPVAIATATATDIFAVTVTNDAPASYPVGTTTVTWTATDANGNVTTKQQKIIVQDTIAPAVTQPANMTVEATGIMTPVTVGSAAATDAVGVVSLISNAPASFPLGDTIITWTAKDAAGNTGIATQTIIVKDSVAPVLAGLANQVLEATSSSGAAASFTVTATDNIDPTPVVICTPATGAIFTLGTATVTCTAKDASDNSVTGSFTVAVKDTTPPVLTIPADKTVEATAPLTPAIGTATATDIFAVTVTNDAPASYPVGTTIVTWTATDANDNVATKQQKITVQDTIAPAVTPPANMTVEATGIMTPVTVGSAAATDAVGVVSLISNAPASFPLGDTIITWTARDAAGNTGTATQTIIVKDTIAPVLAGLANQVLEATSPSGATATFNFTATDTNNPAPIITCSAASGSTFALGDNTVTCTARDISGNTATGTFTIKVQDTTPPVLNVPVNITVLLNTSLTAPASQAFLNGATATDIVDRSVTITTTTTALNTVGVKLVTFTAVDDFGNKTIRTATINVVYGCGDTYLNNQQADYLTPVSILKPFKLGSTIPVKLHLCDANGIDTLIALPRLYLQKFSGDEPVGDPIEVSSTSGADTGNYFRIAGSHYIYNLYTKSLTSGSYQLQAVLDDGTMRTIPLSLKQ